MKTANERFDEKWVEAEEPHPILGTKCWLWTACTTTRGYGQFVLNGKQEKAHRVGYERHVGLIPEGLRLDHICRVRHCVNHEHLEPVTNRENILRGVGATAQAASRTHCPKGHPYSGDNLRVSLDRRRKCRACGRASSKRHRDKLRTTTIATQGGEASDE